MDFNDFNGQAIQVSHRQQTHIWVALKCILVENCAERLLAMANRYNTVYSRRYYEIDFGRKMAFRMAGKPYLKQYKITIAVDNPTF